MKRAGAFATGPERTAGGSVFRDGLSSWRRVGVAVMVHDRDFLAIGIEQLAVLKKSPSRSEEMSE